MWSPFSKLEITEKNVAYMAADIRKWGRFCTSLENSLFIFHCRETFHSHFDNPDIYFTYGGKNPQRVIRLIVHAEKKLNLKDKTTFLLVKLKCGIHKPITVLSIHVADFWMQSMLRKGVFTALLKSGYQHTRLPFRYACKAGYFWGSYPALEMFLSGKTASTLTFTSRANWKCYMQGQKERWGTLYEPKES